MINILPVSFFRLVVVIIFLLKVISFFLFENTHVKTILNFRRIDKPSHYVVSQYPESSESFKTPHFPFQIYPEASMLEFLLRKYITKKEIYKNNPDNGNVKNWN